MLRSCDRKNIEKIRDYLNSNNFKQRVRNHGVEPLIRYHEYNNEFRAPTIYIDLSNNDGNIIKDLALKIYDKFKEKFGNEFEVLFDDRYQFTTFTSSLIIPFNRKNLNIIQGNIENAFPLSAPIEKNVDGQVLGVWSKLIKESDKNYTDNKTNLTEKLNPIYSGVFLSTSEKEKLKKEFPPVHENIYYHHSTIEFKPKDISDIQFGVHKPYKIIGRITTDKVDALLIENPKSKNKYPHITLSTAKDVKPFESNKAFEENPDKIEYFDKPIIFYGTEGIFNGEEITQLQDNLSYEQVEKLFDETTKNTVAEERRDNILNSSNNSSQTSLFGLNIQNQEQLEFHINTLNVVGQFLENIGIEQRLVSEFLSRDGNIVEGAIAAANFIEGTVDIINDVEKRPSAWNKLPEEAAHWWYRLLNENSPLKKALWESHQTALKNDELYKGQYGKLVKSPSDLTEESIGQLIAEAIKRIETKNANASDYSFFKKFLEWINSIIDIFKNTTQDPFEVAAMKILSSDMSDLMTWEEYRKVNNIVNFADVLTEQSVAPVDYTIISDLGKVVTNYFEPQEIDEKDTFKWVANLKDGVQKNSPEFNTQEELDLWVFTNVKEYDQRQKQILQEVRDNQIFFDRLLNKSFRKKSKFLPKTLRKYFDIIDAQNLNPLREWNISQELQQITKKLTPEEKRQIVETNGYTNIAPTLKVLPDLLQKYGRKTTPEIIKQEIEITNKLVKKEITKEQANELRQKLESKKKGNPIVLSQPIKIDGAKKQELSILNGIKEMIKLENPNLKSITAEEFVAEAHNWLETNYLLGFANEKSYLSYRTDQTFTYLKDRVSDEDFQLGNMTEEEIQRLPFEERQRIANIVGLTKQNPDVYHNKVSLRFNDMYHLKSGHFDKSPSAWGNLTYFYTGKNKWKDAVLLHEIQNDNIEFLREFKAEKVDLETSLGRYLQQLNTDLLDNITQIESGGKRIQKKIDISSKRTHTHIQLNYQLDQIKNLPLEQGLQQLKQNLNEKIELFKSDTSKDINKAQELVDKAYSQRRILQDFQKRGGIKSLLTQQELNDLKETLNRLNTEEIMTDAVYMPEENQYVPGYPTIRNLKQKKQDFIIKSGSIVNKINTKLEEMYGADAPIITLNAPAKPLPKANRRPRIVNQGTERERVIGNASQDLNESVNFLLVFSEQQILKQLSKNIEDSKKNFIQARNATNAYNFNVSLSKITEDQYANLIENYKYNQDLLNRLIDEQAQKDIKSPELEKVAKAKSIIKYLGDDNRVKLGKGIYGFMWDTANTDKGIVSVWDAYKAANTIEDSYIDNWTVDEFLEYVKKVAPEYLTLDTKSIDTDNQKQKFETLKQKALDKKAELEKNYGKIEEEVKQTLEIEMNYFTPLIHHLIQKHISQYGKDFPMYFSGYQITKLTQGNDRTALIYAGKDEINIVNKKEFKYNEIYYKSDDNGFFQFAPFLEDNRYFIENNEYINIRDHEQFTITEQEYNKAKQEYEKAYQQATKRRAKEIKFIAASQIGIVKFSDFENTIQGISEETNIKKLSDKQLEEGIKKLNEYKKQSKQNMDRVINTIMNISNSKPIETGAIYNAMAQISGVKLIWQDKIDGLQGNTGGYLVDLSNYNYNTPILYGLYKKSQNIGYKQELIDEAAKNTVAEENVDNKLNSIVEIFNKYPELSKIGTYQEYSEYLDTIFPNSKIKDIVYHGTMEQLLPKDGNFKGYITYFTTDKKYAETFGVPVNRKVVEAVLDIKDPYNSTSELADVPEEIHDKDEYTNPRIIKATTKGFDSVIGVDAGQEEGKTIAVFNPEQIHILGSKQDIKGFKEFINHNKELQHKESNNQNVNIIEDLLPAANTIKTGVSKLFESNPELANQVYSALGFQGSINLESNLKNTGKTEQELTNYLKEKYPEIKLEISNNPIWEQSSDIVKNQEDYRKEVQYRLKATEILLSDKAKQVFNKGNKNNWSLDKILTELAIPKEQKRIILDLNDEDYSFANFDLRESIIIALSSNYSYTVEINTAKDKREPDHPLAKESNQFFAEQSSFGWWNVVDKDDNIYRREIKTKEAAEKYAKELNEQGIPNTQYYYNLTVPGGTNYTENEISTPLITPSIKGHAQFATDKGIGWFRSDDKYAFTGFLEDLLASGTIKKVPCG